MYDKVYLQGHSIYSTNDHRHTCNDVSANGKSHTM